jgi:hypothetical protein
VAVSPHEKPASRWRVEFLHRTVRDFLKTESIDKILKDMAPGYNPWRALSRAVLSELKFGLVTPAERAGLQNISNLARNAEVYDGVADIVMLDELERVCKSQSRLFLSHPSAIQNG